MCNMNYIKKNLQKIILATFVFIWPVVSLAQIITNPNPPPTGSVIIVNPLTNTPTLIVFIQNILTGVIKIGIPVMVLAIIYCGFLFVSARGNPEKISDARRSLIYTLIGAAILIGSLAIAQLIKSTITAL